MFLLGSRATDSLVSTSTVPCRQQGRSLVVYVVRITRADIGARVVIRRRIAGPVPLTDVIGTLQEWTVGGLTVVHDNGEIINVPEADLVAAKVIPARPARRTRPEPPTESGPAADPADPPADRQGPAGQRGPDTPERAAGRPAPTVPAAESCPGPPAKSKHPDAPDVEADR